MSEQETQHEIEAFEKELQRPSRRAVLGGMTAAAVGVGAVGGMFRDGFEDPFYETVAHGTGSADDSYGPEDVIYTMCMQCNTYCTIKVRLTDAAGSGATSLVRKIAGNPYSPLNTQPLAPIPYETAPAAAVKGVGNMKRDSKSRSGGIACLKGQAGPQIVHDAKRITKPLKRVGERGSGRWVTVSWEDAVKGILDGDPDLGTPGLRSWWAYAPKEPVMADWAKVKDGSLPVEEFEATWGDKLIDPKRPELGPRSNLLSILGGDRMSLIGERFALQGLGTINQFNHGGICGVTGVVANARMHPTTGFKRMYADIDHCDYLVVWGTEPLTAQKGPTWLAPRIGAARERGMEMVVIDPRMSKTAEKADLWVPVKPGHDAELAFAIGRWIVENKRYDERYLSAPGPVAAAEIGEPTWSDATHLVKVDDPARGKLTMIDLGRAEQTFDEAGKPIDGEAIAMLGGKPVGVSTADGPGDLFFDGKVRGPEGPIRVRTVFSLLTERLLEREIADLADAAGVDEETVARIGKDFTSHGKQAVIMSYRGAAMHANGFDAIRAIGYLNFLVGNHDWKGGHITGQAKFSPEEGRYDLVTVSEPNTAWGIPITREKVAYESTSFFAQEGYPAKRRWFQFPGNLCHEVIPSAGAGYPYSLNALFMHRHSPLNSAPGAHRNAEILKQTDKIKLVVSFDVTLGDSSMYADYVLPDLTYLERFSQESVYPSQQYAVTQLGQPTTRAFRGPRPVEETYLELLTELGLPGVGRDAFGPGAHFATVVDYWLKVAANVAYAGDRPVPDADAEEQRVFLEARRRALGDAFDEKAWRAAVTAEEWPKVVYVLNRGGRFSGQAPDRADGYEGEWLRNRYAGLCAFYDPKVAAAKDSFSGQTFDGLARIREPLRSDGTPVDRTGRPLQFINWKSRHQGTHRTANSAWLREIRPSNYVWVNSVDARARGIETGDRVRITSSTATAEGVAMVVESIRPGVIGADATYGHRGYFATAVEIDGETVNPPARYGHGESARQITPMHEETGYAGSRSEGFAVNSLLDDDNGLGGGGLTDPIGGGAAQQDTWVELERVASA